MDAEPVPITIAVGVDQVVGDWFLSSTGLRASVDLDLGRHAGLRAVLGTFVWFPYREDAGLNPGLQDLRNRDPVLCKQMVDPCGGEVAFTVTRMHQFAELLVRVVPVHARTGPWSGSAEGYAGVAALRTVEDLALAQAYGIEEAEATADQVHPAGVVGLAGTLRRGRVGLRARLDTLLYVEDYGQWSDAEGPFIVGAEGTWSF